MKKIGDIKIPVLGLGTWQLRGRNCVEILKRALELGYRHIDTAEYYDNEKEIGEAIKDFNREELFIVSKVMPYNLTYEKVLKACDGSISRLKTEIDLYLIHWPVAGMDFKEVFRAFKKLKEEGKIKSIGVSNFNIKQLKEAIKICNDLKLKIATNQVEFHPLLYQKELLEFCKQNDILITAYSPLAKGLIVNNEIIKKVAEKYNKTSAQISLKWLLQKGTIVIPKAGSEKHLKENLDIFDFELEKEDVKKIDNIGGKTRLVNLGV